jgi:hypothetical protein
MGEGGQSRSLRNKKGRLINDFINLPDYEFWNFFLDSGLRRNDEWGLE